MDENNEQAAKSRNVRYVYSALLCYLMFVVGTQLGAMGPVLVDLSRIYNVDVGTISILPSLSSVGHCLGAFSNILFRWINRQLTCAVFLTIGSVCFVFLPYASSIYVAYALNLFVGISLGMQSCAINVWLLEMWQENPNPMLQLSQSISGLGLIVAPLVESLYTTGNADGEGTTNSSVIARITSEERRQNLTVPFAIFSGIMLVGAGIGFFMYFIRRYDPPPKEVLKKFRNSSGNTNETKLFERENAPKILMIILTALCLGSFVSVEMAFSNFSATFFQYMPLRVSGSDAAKIQSAFSASFTVSRACNFFISMKLKPRTLLIIHYGIQILSFIALFFASQSLVLLWIANVTLGYGFSAIYGSTLTIVKKYLVINDTVGGILVSSIGVFGAFVPYLSSLQIEYSPMSFLYVTFGVVLLNCLLQVIIHFIIRLQKAKSKS